MGAIFELIDYGSVGRDAWTLQSPVRVHYSLWMMYSADHFLVA